MSIGDFDQKTFIRKVRSFMAAHKLSVLKFAKMANIPNGTVFRAFYQKDALKLVTLKKFQKAMDNYKVPKNDLTG